MWIHGGGWVLFDIDTYDASCRGLANKTGAIVVSPGYRRAPEAVFPAAHDDVLAAYRWTVANASRIGGDPDRIGIGGESVGGNMAPATILQLAAAGEPVPAAQVCVYPLTTAEQYGESMEDAADGRPLNRALLSWMAAHAFDGRPDAAKDPRVDLLGLLNRPAGGHAPDPGDHRRARCPAQPGRGVRTTPAGRRSGHDPRPLRRGHARVLRRLGRPGQGRTGPAAGCRPLRPRVLRRQMTHAPPAGPSPTPR
ncbi:alpha/beta hydrolase [Streptomyces radiopugnans]|nr:alpha/beta hydrolase [Streptomyces radiopugnans]